MQIKVSLQKWEVKKSFPLKYLLTLHLYYLPLQHMSNMMLLDLNTNRHSTQYKVGYMWFPYIKIHNMFRDKLKDTV